MVHDDLRSDHSADTPTPAADPDQRADRSPSAGDVTMILSAIEQGDGQAAEQLLAAGVRGTPQAGRRQDGPGEAGADAAGHGAGPRGVHPAGGCGARPSTGTAEAISLLLPRRPCGGFWWRMRGEKRARRRGGDHHRVELSHVDPGSSKPQLDVLALNDALDKLSRKTSAAAELVKLRYFAGLTAGTSGRRCWAYPRNCLRRIGLTPSLGCVGAG